VRAAFSRLRDHIAVSRLESLARRAPESYGLSGRPGLALLRAGPGKCLWLVEHGPGVGRHLLRMYLRPPSGERHVRSIVRWQRALRREAGLPVPDPILTESGALLHPLPADRGSPGAFRRLAIKHRCGTYGKRENTTMRKPRSVSPFLLALLATASLTLGACAQPEDGSEEGEDESPGLAPGDGEREEGGEEEDDD